jgi:hypothetical protein
LRSAIKLAPHLLDGEPQMGNQCLGARCFGACPRKLCFACAKQTLQRFDIIGKSIIGAHCRS